MTPEKSQVPGEAKERGAEGENTQPLSLNYSAFVKHSHAPTRCGVAMGAAEMYSRAGVPSFKV